MYTPGEFDDMYLGSRKPRMSPFKRMLFCNLVVVIIILMLYIHFK